MSDKGKRGLREGGGNCLKYLKRGSYRKEGREAKILKRDQVGGCLKKGGKPVRTMVRKFSLQSSWITGACHHTRGCHYTRHLLMVGLQP